MGLSSTLRIAAARWWALRKKGVEHDRIVEQSDEDGQLSGNYLFMCAASAGIAISGLLLNSPAVIIGAMLVSPLMAPIVRLGLGLTTLNPSRVASASVGLFGGMGVALIISIGVVLFSPIKEATPEILARTSPNLFDLMVATFSGLAGGYALVRGKGGAIVGVAIATALMPPMTVVGFGIATADASVTTGALLLFLTNIVAISLSVTMITIWYGFNRNNWRKALMWQSVVILLVVIPLCWPLFFSLQDIARLSAYTRDARQAIVDSTQVVRGKILDLQVLETGPGKLRVDVTIAMTDYAPEVRAELLGSIQDKTGTAVDLHVTPLILANPAQLNRSPVAAKILDYRPEVIDRVKSSDIKAELDVLTFFPVEVDYDAGSANLTVRVQLDQAISLSTMHSLERALQVKYPKLTVRVIPPAPTAQLIYFNAGQSELTTAQIALLEDIAWSFSRHEITRLRLEGRASSDGGGTIELAGNRAALLAEYFKTLGYDVTGVDSRFPLPDQKQQERIHGAAALRSVLLIPVSDAADAETSN